MVQDEFAALVEAFTGRDGMHETPIPRAVLYRASQPTEPTHGIYDPAICLVAQGRKRVMLGDDVFDYDRACYLVVSVDLPVIGHVVDATPDEPYLCLKLKLDPAMLGALIMETGLGTVDGAGSAPGMSVSRMTPELTDAAVRLLRLLRTPGDIPVLAPLIEREILYRLMQGDQAVRLRQIAMGDSRLQQVNRAIGWIKRNFKERIRIEDVAAEARMSPSALHHHFKAVTSMSPLQYQKQLRLQEARRLILARAMDAATASFNVGYESPSQFSREYRRLFGAPPVRDVARLRDMPDAAMGV